MKTKIGILFVAICFSTVAFAQKPKERKEVSPEQMAQRQTEMLKTRLQLNEAQKQKVYELNLKYNNENKMLMEQMQELKKKMLELNQNKESELKGMLTPEQNAAYDLWRQDRKREMRKNFKAEKRPEPGTAQPRK